jgi:ABC transporter, ATP-binding protein
VWVIAALGLGAWLTAHNHITAGAASAAVFLAVRAETQIFNTMFFLNDIQEGMTRLGRAVALAKLYTPTGQRTAPDLEKPADVTIRGLEFSYPDTTEPVLPTLDLTLAAGTTTALVDASGAGKSTLAALMSGLLRPTAGTITVGDVDIAQVSDVWTARNVTLISQEVHIFSGTLRDDLRMAAPTATDGELLDALAAVGLPENGTAFRRAFPLGLDTQVGAGAVPLMPEVQQQIALARVLLRNPHVLILDEATSEAGSDQAHTLEAAAELVTQGRTALVVAHRLDQAVVADRIIVMDAGRIIEDGRHTDLVAAGGRYAQLFARWSGQDHTM